MTRYGPEIHPALGSSDSVYSREQDATRGVKCPSCGQPEPRRIDSIPSVYAFPGRVADPAAARGDALPVPGLRAFLPPASALQGRVGCAVYGGRNQPMAIGHLKT